MPRHWQSTHDSVTVFKKGCHSNLCNGTLELHWGIYRNDFGLSLMPGSGKFQWVPKHAEKKNEFISGLESRRLLLLCNRQFRSEFHINGNGKCARKTERSSASMVPALWFLIETYSALKVLKNTADKHEVIVYHELS